MRRAILLSLALVALLSTSAFASAINTTISGNVGIATQYDQHEGLVTRGLFNASVSVSNNTGSVQVEFGNISIGYGGTITDRRHWKPFYDHALFNPSSKAIELVPQRARIQLKGALYKNGPEVTTTAGRLNFDWNPIVASNQSHNSAGVATTNSPLSRADGILIEGIPVGPFKADLGHFYVSYTRTQPATDPGPFKDRPTVVRLAGKLDAVDLTVIGVNHEHKSHPGDKDQRVTDYLVTAGLTPANGVKLNAAYAVDGQTDDAHYKLTAELSTIDNLKLTGSFWSTGKDFAPRYAHRDEPDLWKTDKRTVRKDQAGAFEISASTVQGGITFDASYGRVGKHSDADWQTTRTMLGAKTKVSNFDLNGSVQIDTETGKDNVQTVKFGASTNLSGVTVAYEGESKTNQNMKNAISAKTTVDTIFADGVNISGKVTLQDGGDPEVTEDTVSTKVELDVEWKAPSGIGLGLHYANYGRAAMLNKGNTDTLRHNGVPYTEISGSKGEPDGFYVTASYTAKF